jgi:glycosyltransferase involved in cell wall biosynthesis
MLEAMACGLPVAAFPVNGPIDVVRHGETGYLDDDLGEACRQALQLDRSACRRYAETFSWQRCTADFVARLARRPDPGEGRPVVRH